MDVLKTFGDYYTKGDYANALLVLQQHPKDVSSGLWHYNMGTVYSKLENMPLARYHFISAENHGFNSPEVSGNLDLIETKLELSKVEKPLTSADFLIKGGTFLATGYLTTLSLIVVMIGLLVIKKAPSFKKISFLLLAALMPLVLNFWINSWNRAIVMGTQTIMDGPSKIFSASGELPPGVLVITKSDGEWKEIIYPSRFHGWIQSSVLKELE